MSTNVQEQHSMFLFLENCTIIAGDINTPASGESLINGMVVEKLILRIMYEKILALDKLRSNLFWKFLESLQEQTVKFDFHVC